MLPDLKTNADGSLTLYIQKDEPTDPDQKANWLAGAGRTDLHGDAPLLAQGRGAEGKLVAAGDQAHRGARALRGRLPRNGGMGSIVLPVLKMVQRNGTAPIPEDSIKRIGGLYRIEADLRGLDPEALTCFAKYSDVHGKRVTDQVHITVRKIGAVGRG